jgi:Fic family protein
MRKYQKTHPWLTFNVDLKRASPQFWMALGEAQSKCEHVAGVPLTPQTAQTLHQVYLAKGVLATTAIEGNTLSEQEVLKHLEGKLTLPPSQQYQQQEIQNIVSLFNKILNDVQNGAEDILTPEAINAINSGVLRDLSVDADVVPGAIRRDSRVVGRYLCAPAEDCQYLLGKFCDWLNGRTFLPADGYRIVYGIIKAVVAHIYFVWIHPYGDGNGRTARMLELKFLMESGVPSDAAHLLSNHYNHTRVAYYRNLDAASKSGGEIFPFIEYAVQGFVDQLREQVRVIRDQQVETTWTNHVHEALRDGPPSVRRQRLIVLALPHNESVPRSAIPKLTPELAATYAGKTLRTLGRDLNDLVETGLITLEQGRYSPNIKRVLAFLPTRRVMSWPRPATSQAQHEQPDDTQLELI